jgi:hypothetical protein
MTPEQFDVRSELALHGTKTLVEFKTAVNDGGEHDVLLSDQLTAYRLAEPDVERPAICVFVKKARRKLSGTSPSARPNSRIEYLRKVEMMARQITQRVFYKRVGFWCRQCDFLPLCLGRKKRKTCW